MEKSKFWYESSATSSVVTRVNVLAGGRRPVVRANRRQDSPSDVAVCGKVWPLEGAVVGEEDSFSGR